MNENGVPQYSIITQDSAPIMFQNIFDLIESRYSRRSRYIKDITDLKYAVERLRLNNDHQAYIDSSGNIVFKV